MREPGASFSDVILRLATSRRVLKGAQTINSVEDEDEGEEDESDEGEGEEGAPREASGQKAHKYL
jgi:hypothetical protein